MVRYDKQAVPSGPGEDGFPLRVYHRSPFISLAREFIMRIKKENTGDFPGGPVGKTQRSQCRGARFDSWLGN